MRTTALLGLVVLCGCGRRGFGVDDVDVGSVDGATVDGPAVDAAIATAAARFPRLGAVAISNPQNFDSPIFRDLARKHHVVVVGHWPGWDQGYTMTMSEVMGDIKARSTVGTRLFAYLSNAELWDPQAPGDAWYAAYQKLYAESWWLYPSGATGTPVRYPSVANLGICNNTDFGPTDATGKTWIRWKTEYDHQWAVVGDASNAPNPYLDGFYTPASMWKPRVDGDWNRDGVTDSQNDSVVQGWVRGGVKTYFDTIRAVWPGSVQIGTADWGSPTDVVGVLDQQLEGGFMAMIGQGYSVETWGGFDAMMAQYRKLIDSFRAPKLALFGHEQWAAGDYQGMRYGLASALMDDGYFSIGSTGCCPPDGLLWFDEFDFDLGYPTQPRQTTAWSQGVWRRDFDNGIALVNPKGNGAQTLILGGTFRKLAGTQDPVTNDGAAVTTVTLADRAGLILSR